MRALWSARREQVPEDIEGGIFEIAREVVVAPGRLHQACAPARSPCRSSARASAKRPLVVVGTLLGEIAAHEGRIAAVRPQRRLGSAAQHYHRGPAGIFHEEGHVTAEIDAVVLVAAQDRPFDQLAGNRVGDRLSQVGSLRGLPLRAAETASLRAASSAGGSGEGMPAALLCWCRLSLGGGGFSWHWAPAACPCRPPRAFRRIRFLVAGGRRALGRRALGLLGARPAAFSFGAPGAGPVCRARARMPARASTASAV